MSNSSGHVSLSFSCINTPISHAVVLFRSVSCPPPHTHTHSFHLPRSVLTQTHTGTQGITHLHTCVSTWSLNKSPRFHISLIYGLNLSTNSVQSRRKQETTTPNSQFSVSRHLVILLSQLGGKKLPPVAAVALSSRSSCYCSSPTIANSFQLLPWCLSFPPLFGGASSKAEPRCVIVCHCRITALAQRTCQRHGGGDLHDMRSVLPLSLNPSTRKTTSLYLRPKLLSGILSCQISFI